MGINNSGLAMLEWCSRKVSPRRSVEKAPKQKKLQNKIKNITDLERDKESTTVGKRCRHIGHQMLGYARTLFANWTWTQENGVLLLW